MEGCGPDGPATLRRPAPREFLDAPRIAADGAWTYRLPGVGDVQNGAQFYERENAQGSVISTVDASGTTVSRSAYDAYGGQSVLLPGALSRYGFAGKSGYAQDGATGTLLCGARFDLPAIGRFLVPDPIGHDGGLNLYAYCDDNPVGKVDPSGHKNVFTDTLSAMWQMANIFQGLAGGIGGQVESAHGWNGRQRPELSDGTIVIRGGWLADYITHAPTTLGPVVLYPSKGRGGNFDSRTPKQWSNIWAHEHEHEHGHQIQSQWVGPLYMP